MEETQTQSRDSKERAAQERSEMTDGAEEVIIILVLLVAIAVLVACTSVWEYVQSMLAGGW
jgi:hypothetical protein